MNVTKIILTSCLLDFSFKMDQIQFRLWLRPIPHWESSQRFPRPLATSGEEGEGMGGEGKGKEGEGRGERRR